MLNVPLCSLSSLCAVVWTVKQSIDVLLSDPHSSLAAAITRDNCKLPPLCWPLLCIITIFFLQFVVCRSLSLFLSLSLSFSLCLCLCLLVWAYLIVIIFDPNCSSPLAVHCNPSPTTIIGAVFRAPSLSLEASTGEDGQQHSQLIFMDEQQVMTKVVLEGLLPFETVVLSCMVWHHPCSAYPPWTMEGLRVLPGLRARR